MHPRIQLTVTPGSRQILRTIIESGVYEDLMNAGARMLEPVCGPCVGIGQAPLQGAASLRTFNRNFPGRSGTAEDEVYLCSPSTAAASALTGRITDPSTRPPLVLRPAGAADVALHETLITHRLPADVRAQIVVERGPNLVSPPLPEPVSDNLQARVLISVGDDISTGDMAPDGAIAMSVWSNIALCAKFMFTRHDSDFHDRAREWGGGVIVAGDNYGQGSSREHAALIPVYLGIRVIAARSYARIHRRNLIAAGITPLVLTSEAPSFDVGQHWSIIGLRDALISGAETVEVEVSDHVGPIAMQLDLTSGERAVLAAGGLLAYIRQGGRSPVPDTASATILDYEGTVV